LSVTKSPTTSAMFTRARTSSMSFRAMSPATPRS
jgi:hypothetical protein